jgi:hypothetical protein
MEYNMNSLIDGVTVVSSSTADDYISGITEWSTKKSNPFKLLFPVDSIIKSFRPEYPGAKYFIMGGPNVKDTYSSDSSNPPFLPFRTLKYTGEGKNFNVQGAKPRLYYPGVDTDYKYWLSPLNKNIDLTVQYLQTTTTWANAGKTGSIPTGNKAALANKIIIKFEKFHSIPTNYKVTITKNDNTTSVVGPLTTTSSESGLISLTLEGGSWTKRDYASGPSSFLPIDNPILIKSIRLEATNPGTSGNGKYLGVIEISARWVTDITSDIVEMQVNKESSSSTENILPVGLVTANTMTASLNRFNQTALKIKTYDRDSTSFETDVIYLAKNAEMRSYFDVIHPAGATTQSGLTFDRIQQGTFFIDSWSISQYGESSVTALDGSKYLMETLCPDLLCQNAPVVSILRNLLDAIGFTNYNFNIISGVNTEDKSIPNVNYWWTEDTSTVWDEIQSLCRDIQMNAVFDENNILQFYSRDYLYSQTNSTQNFYQTQNGSNLPNIVSFNKKEIASANSVKVIWKSPLSSNYLGNSDYLWQSNESFLSAGALQNPSGRPEGPAMNSTDQIFIIDNTSLDPYKQQQSFYNYSGFVLIDSEIIEYEAVGYTYQPIDLTQAPVPVWIFSGSDVNKYLSLSAPGYEDPTKPETAYFKPDGRYKVKTRGALGTVAAEHKDASDKVNDRSIWKGAIVTYGGKQAVSVGSNGNNSSYNFKTQIQVVEQPTANSLVIDSKTDAPYLKYDIQELSETNANVGQLVTGQISLGVNRDNLFTIGPSGSDLNQSLKSGVKYRITLTPQNQAATQRGNSQTIVYRVIKNQFNGSVASNPNDPTLIASATKSFFKLGSSNLNSQQCAVAFRSFDAINVPASTSVSGSYPASYFGDYYQSYADSHYYSFGTTMFLDRSSVNPSQSGGVGFFVNNLGTTGYFIIIETLKSAAPANRKSVRIVKATQSGIKNLIDSQVTLPNTLDGIYGGLAYNIDVKVKLSGQRLEIKAMINGFSVNAVDINSSDLVKDDNWMLTPTKNVGLISIQGTTTFDYVYGASIEKDNYDSSSYVPNLYQAQFSNDLLNTAYGDLIYNTGLGSDEVSKKLKSSVDEFGTVVREIAYIKQKFDSRPSFPITWTTGANKYASIIGSKLSSFGAEAYILNNASVRIPLSDGGANTLSIIGNQLGDSGELVYSTDDTSDYSAKEPLVFKSSWIQNEQDAKNLAEWIKAKVVNKGRIVNMSVFGNPLISVGEIVSIYNSYQGFSGTEKLIVTEVNHTFSQGLETSVTCRTL